MDEETRVALLELRASIAELRADLAEFRSGAVRRLDTIIDEIAAFRAEYNQHTHE